MYILDASRDTSQEGNRDSLLHFLGHAAQFLFLFPQNAMCVIMFLIHIVFMFHIKAGLYFTVQPQLLKCYFIRC